MFSTKMRGVLGLNNCSRSEKFEFNRSFTNYVTLRAKDFRQFYGKLISCVI